MEEAKDKLAKEYIVEKKIDAENLESLEGYKNNPIYGTKYEFELIDSKGMKNIGKDPGRKWVFYSDWKIGENNNICIYLNKKHEFLTEVKTDNELHSRIEVLKRIFAAFHQAKSGYSDTFFAESLDEFSELLSDSWKGEFLQ